MWNWFFADRITPDIDLIISGMHAKANNPELTEAKIEPRRFIYARIHLSTFEKQT